MQNSALYRRGVVLPLDQEAEDALRAGDVSPQTSVRVLPISSDSLFEGLWEMGLFERIDAECGSIIDDYEEEMIDASLVPRLLRAVESMLEGAKAEAQVKTWLGELRGLAKHAVTVSRPLLFVL